MTFRFYHSMLLALALACAGPLFAEDEAPAQDLPEPVAKLVDALSGVQRVEKAEDGMFLIERKMQLTGSRVLQTVELRANEKGEIVDWGRTPHATRRYTLEELRSTGQSDLARMLSRLDPAIQLGPGA